jgi:hypothetical protein
LSSYTNSRSLPARNEHQNPLEIQNWKEYVWKLCMFQTEAFVLNIIRHGRFCIYLVTSYYHGSKNNFEIVWLFVKGIYN